ncbi:MAG: ArnT family glycosyltransferase [Candidatus Binataceae bacterium]
MASAGAGELNRAAAAADIRTSSAIASSAAPAESSLWRRASIVVLVLTAILFFARIGARALWSSEFRWAEIAREMVLTHRYFWPTINGRVYFDKPLGSYWLIVATSYLTGTVSEAAARIPCAIAGLIAVGLLILLARRLYDLRTGVIAAFILATSFSFVFFSRTASADVATITGELAALLLFLRNEERVDGWWVMGLWVIMAATSLMKGLLGFVLPIVVIGVYSCLADGWRELGEHVLHGALAARIRWLIERNRWFFNWRTVIAVAVGVLTYYVPFAISHAETGSTKGIYMVYRENVERYFEPFDHRGPIYLYTYVIFALMAPWSVFIPAALAHAHQQRRNGADRARSERFVLVFFWATFIFFTASGSRRSYYLLPILPAAAILVARLLGTPRESLSTTVRRLLNLGYGVIVAAVLFSTLAFVPPSWFLPHPYSTLPPAPDRAFFAVYWVLAVAAIIYALAKFDSRRVTVSLCAIAYLFMFYFYVFAMPAGDAWRGERPFALRTQRTVGTNLSELAFFKSTGPVFYLGYPKPVPEYDTSAALDAAVKEGSVKWLISRRRDASRLNIPAIIVDGEAVYPWDSKRHRLNSMVLLRIGPPHT